MKAKRLTKLALSGVALAAVAATLGTSTYAWYVTNSTATASGVQGTANAGGAGNVLVAQASTADTKVNGHGAFVQNLTFDTTNYTSTTTASGLNPVSPATASVASDASPSTVSGVASITADTVWVDKDGLTVEGGSSIDFDIWVLSTSKTTVNLTYTISNTTATGDVKKQLAYANTGLPTNVSQGNSFAANIVDALRMSVVAEGASITNGTSTTTNIIYDVAASASATSSTYGSYTTGGSANEYLVAVLGEQVVKTGPTTVSQTTKNIPLTVVANAEAKLSFKIWLEGTDDQCFDSCAGQTFAINFSFTGA
ncbi:MAG: hypothetical protein K6E20_01175 [Acholeplasmatales bacterium]|nr:hypothetical protein [Acholeplasmatales bacterium]